MPSIPIADVIIPEDRQREETGDLTGLRTSMHDRGLINSIVLEGKVLRTGFRRLSAAKALGWTEIPFRDIGELSPIEREVIELEENLHRKNLTWQEEGRGIKRIHQLKQQERPEWKASDTARYLGVSESTISYHLTVQRELQTNPDILKSETLRTAHKTTLRLQERRKAQIVEAAARPQVVRDVDSDEVPEDADVHEVLPAEQTILHTNFLEWAPSYDGSRFNLLHCDFPYGINFQNTGQGNPDQRWQSYSDSPDVYWQLCGCLCENFHTLMAGSAHIVFWLSMGELLRTLVFFREHAPQIQWHRNPLIWHKSDGKGIIADASHEPRHTYEVALFGTVGRRTIVSAKADSHSAPTNKNEAIHQSEKPQPVLEHFLAMLTDDTTALLDPTCGSGSAIRAAERLGASHTLGLEISDVYVEDARRALRIQREALVLKEGELQYD